MLMTCVMRTMRQKAFSRQMDLIPHALPVMPAGPSLSFPQFLAGIQSTQSCSSVQSGGIPLRQDKHDRRMVSATVSDGQ